MSTGTYTLTPTTYAIGWVSGTVSLTVSGEGLAGEASYAPVAVDYSGDSVTQRVTAGAITLGNSNGRFMSTQSVGGSSTL